MIYTVKAWFKRHAHLSFQNKIFLVTVPVVLLVVALVIGYDMYMSHREQMKQIRESSLPLSGNMNKQLLPYVSKGNYSILSGFLKALAEQESVLYVILTDSKYKVANKTDGAEKYYTKKSRIKTIYSSDIYVTQKYFSPQTKSWVMEVQVLLFRGDAKYGSLRIGYAHEQVTGEIRKTVQKSLFAVAIGILIAMVASLLTTRFITAPIRRFISDIKIISDGDLSHQVNIKTKDEIGRLATVFNELTKDLKQTLWEKDQSYKKIARKNVAIQRFVPSEFLHCLGKEEVEDVDLGDASHEEMSVLFSDIRSFTSISEAMSHEENFRFLNEYLNYIAPMILKSGGFIDKFIGDAIMALFAGAVEGAADDAVTAAVGMQVKLMEFNRSRKESGDDPVSIGIGIHTGPLSLGIIGFEERVESTVIGDTVNLSSRLESLTKQYGIMIAISSSTYQKLKDRTKLLIREVDTVQVKGKDEPVTIYDVFSADPDNTRESKIRILDRYHEGLSLYKERKWHEVIKLFHELKNEVSSDKIIDIYLERCNSFLINRPDESWTGVHSLSEK